MAATVSPASARVVVRADNPKAGAANVRIAFRAEARSRDSGIAFLRVRLPRGLDAGDFDLVDGPKGWRLSRTPDGYNVGGPPTGVGEDAAYQVVINRLPNVTKLAFPTVQQYSDGLIERDNPTPVLVLDPRRQPAPPPRRKPPQPPRAEPPRVETPVERPPTEPPPRPSASASAEIVAPPALPSPTESASPEASATTNPTPEPVAYVANRGRFRIWLWVVLGAALLLAVPVAVLAWSLRRQPARAARRRLARSTAQ